MQQLQSLLVVVSVNLVKRGEIHFLVGRGPDQKWFLPTEIITDQDTTLMAAARLLKRLTGVEARMGATGWVDLKPCPLADAVDRIEQGRRMIAVPYLCLLPAAVAELAVDAGWSWQKLDTLNECMHLDHFTILQNCVQRV